MFLQSSLARPAHQKQRCAHSVSARQTLVSRCEQLGAYAPRPAAAQVCCVPAGAGAGGMSPHYVQRGVRLQAGMCIPDMGSQAGPASSGTKQGPPQPALYELGRTTSLGAAGGAGAWAGAKLQGQEGNTFHPVRPFQKHPPEGHYI